MTFALDVLINNALLNEVLSISVKDRKYMREAFTVDLSLAWHALMVAMCYRDAIVRNEAIRILTSHPERDGLWDAAACLAIFMRSCKMKEGNVAEGSLEEQRLQLRNRECLFHPRG